MENKELIMNAAEEVTKTAEEGQTLTLTLRLEDVALIGGGCVIASGLIKLAYRKAIKPVCEKAMRALKGRYVRGRLRKAKVVESAAEEKDPMELTEEDLNVGEVE